MSTLAIELNDAGIAVADATGLLAIEPGYVLVERHKVVSGDEARGQARLRPGHVSSRHWSTLSLETNSGPGAPKSAAELAFAQLAALWERFGRDTGDVIFVVPGGYSTEQLGLLLGLAQECGMPVRALVDAAAAASVRPYPGRQLMYVDASLHRVSATLLDQDAEAAIDGERELGTGLAALTDAFARRIADMFVRATRFDPFRHADTEQLLYDRLPEWLAQLDAEDSLELVLPHRGEEFRVSATRDAVLAAAAGFYRAIAQLIAQQREAGRGLVVQLSDRLASLPGFVAELARLDDLEVEALPAGHAARSVLLDPEPFAGATEHVKLLKHLPWRAAPAELEEAAVRAPQPRPPVRAGAPRHLVHNAIVHRIGARGLVVGRDAAADGRRTIVIDERHSGVSREHCEIVLRDGELKVRDLSRYGTFVNEQRIAGEAELERGDVIRVGTPGAELTVVSMEAGDDTAQ